MCNERTVSTARGEAGQGGREDVEGKNRQDDMKIEAYLGDDGDPGKGDHYEGDGRPAGAQHRVMSELKENGSSDSEKGHAQNRACSAEEYGEFAEERGEFTEKAGEVAKEHAERAEKHGLRAEEHGEGAEEHGEGAEEHGEGAEEHGEGAEEHGEGAEEHGEGMEEHGEGAEEHGEGAEEHGEGAEEHGEGVEEHGESEAHSGRYEAIQNHVNGLEVERRSEAGPSNRNPETDPYGEIAILVVANEEEDKANLVNHMKQGNPVSWTVEPPVGMVRTHSRRQYPFRRIIEPTPLHHIRSKSPAAIARRWISENSLRRIIANRCVIGVFVITPKVLKDNCTASITNYANCWVDVLTILFGEQKKGVLFVVNHDGNLLGNTARKKLRNFISHHGFNPNNIVYSESGNEVMNVLEHNIATTANSPRTAAPPSFWIRPFYLHGKWNPARKHSVFKTEKHTVWGSEGVILFGQTGKGKSTLAQMLTTGKLDPSDKNFSYSAGKRGHTKGVEEGEGRGWYVVDSPGFGEPEDGTIPSAQAQRMFKRFIYLINGTYAHYIFVTMGGDRVDKLDKDLWEFFNDLLGKELCAQFSIVISDADEGWIQRNRKDLKATFKGCKSFIPAKFPPYTEEKVDEEILAEYPNAQEELREENERFVKDQQLKSLQHLEERLARLRRPDRACEYGRGSKMSRMMERDRANQDMRVEKSLVRRMINKAPRLLFGLDECFSGVVHRLAVSKRVKLVPLSL